MSLQTKIDGALVRNAALLADQLRDALLDSVDPKRIADLAVEHFPSDVPVSPVDARSWVAINVKPDMRKVNMVVEDLLAVGWVLGEDVALSHYAKVRLQKAYSRKNLIEALNTNWDEWTPGNRAAEALVRQPSGLQKLIGKYKSSTVDGMSKTTVNRIGTMLADSLAAGGSPAALGATIRAGVREVAGDSARALTIANTEMARAMSQSCLNSYQNFGVEQVEWLALEACEICGENADASPIPTGQVFPSGDDAPPAHPNCRCTLVAVVDESLLPPLEGETMGLTPENVAQRVYADAAVNESSVSGFIADLRDEYDAKSFGWNFRQKEVDSLTRKLIDDAAFDYQGDIFKAAENVSDALRYTYLYSPENIAAKANEVIDAIRAKGWAVRVKNTWTEGSMYKGINCAMVAPNGQRVELQFHTPRSAVIKETRSHKIYDVLRETAPNDPAYNGLQDDLIRLWERVEQPPNISSVK